MVFIDLKKFITYIDKKKEKKKFIIDSLYR